VSRISVVGLGEQFGHLVSSLRAGCVPRMQPMGAAFMKELKKSHLQERSEKDRLSFLPADAPSASAPKNNDLALLFPGLFEAPWVPSATVFNSVFREKDRYPQGPRLRLSEVRGAQASRARSAQADSPNEASWELT